MLTDPVMDRPEVPDDVRVLLFEHIHTFEQIETLLLLRNDPTRSWTASSLSERLKISQENAGETLEHLGRTSLVVVTGQAASAQFRYSPSNRALDETTTRLASAYEDARLEILRLMSSNAVERLRSSALRVFADSFVLKKKKDDGDE
jgi:hypothetical protein